MNLRRKLFYILLYYLRKPPWDTGISPPELLAFIDAHAPGRALDLGCGTGTNAIQLAQRGWQVTGVDFIGKAIRTAKRKARAAGVAVDFKQGDVTRLDDVTGPFDLALDIGCFHSLGHEGKQRYVDQLTKLLATGSTYLMYGFIGMPGRDGPGLSTADLQLLDTHLNRVDQQNGYDRREITSTWLTYRK